MKPLWPRFAVTRSIPTSVTPARPGQAVHCQTSETPRVGLQICLDQPLELIAVVPLVQRRGTRVPRQLAKRDPHG
ncbi:hypothetical protein [Protofrankia coriariae]|uniref:Uncharacterized protein n=1 Tax=Protofrankia coriariae TaxID=1562887 RepID=A0ABR5EYI8_9ACTN|nr:hypothetical protein [Protofrankia coriariae]KLL09534.1 hypothetical protein FrCorBMG51_24200 [Protofrankia coriariae]ONH30742.1 hypothetical protein BL254_23835 [Protofrankia sp. BMG5.30]